MSRTSMSRNIWASWVIIPGLAVIRSMRPKKSRASGLSAWLGAATSVADPSPQFGRMNSAPDSSSASAGVPIG